MTRKDYAQVAAQFAMVTCSLHADEHQMRLLRGLALALCEVFKVDNPAFDSARFLLVCGL